MTTIHRLSFQELGLAKELILLFQEDDGISRPVIPSDDNLGGLLRKPDFYLLVAREGEELMGGLTAYELPGYKTTRPKLFLYEIAVKPAWRRQGIGKRLVRELLQLCRRRGGEKLFVETSRKNKPAMKLFEATGGSIHPDSITFSYPMVD